MIRALFAMMLIGPAVQAQASMPKFGGTWKIALSEGPACAPKISVKVAASEVTVTPLNAAGVLATQEKVAVAEAVKKVIPHFEIKGINQSKAQGFQAIRNFSMRSAPVMSDTTSRFENGTLTQREAVFVNGFAAEWVQREMEIYSDGSLVITVSGKLTSRTINYRCVYIR